MNRETIKKYEKEFNHWLNGGEVQRGITSGGCFWWIQEDEPLWDEGFEYRKKPEEPQEKKWEDFGEVKGWSLGGHVSSLEYILTESRKVNIGLWPTKKEAIQARAKSQLAQWRDKANGEKLEHWCDWADVGQLKYVLYADGDEILGGCTKSERGNLAFKSNKIMEQFLKHHKSLIEEALL